MKEVSKGKMIDLCLNAPEGATHWMFGDACYVEGYMQGADAFHSQGKWVYTDYTGEDTIKLDFSVLKGMGEDKPVYTQEMADAGELPPVGCECLISTKTGMNTEWSAYAPCKLEFLSSDMLAVVLFQNESTHSHYAGTYKFTPIDTRTDQEKLIDELAERIFNCVHPTLDFDNSIGSAWVEAAQVAINITRKGESNA